MKKLIIQIFIICLMFSSFSSIEEIEYRIIHHFIGKVLDIFSVKFNRLTGIKAEYEEMEDFEDISKGKKYYNLTNEDFNFPSMKELFKLFNKIDFPNETNWVDNELYDVPIWHLIVDGKDYHSNVGTYFMDKFQEIIKIYDIMKYCKDNYE